MNRKGNPSSRIALFDSGIGGLELLNHLAQVLPDEQWYYFADTKNNPYGTKSPQDVELFLTEIIDGLILRRIKLLVIACNTASVVFESLRPDHPLKRRLRDEEIDVVTMAHSGAASELCALEAKRLVVLGTELTTQNGTLARLAQEAMPGLEVLGLSGQPFVELVENWPDEAERLRTVKAVLQPIKDFQADAVWLACTHFGLLLDPIREELGSNIHLVNPARSLAHFIRNLLDIRALRHPKDAELEDIRPVILFTNGEEDRVRGQLARLGYAERVKVRAVDIRDEFSGKRVDVVGFGGTGQSVLRFLAGQNVGEVVIRDKAADLPQRVEAMEGRKPESLNVIGGEDYLSNLRRSDLVVRSPGVPADRPEFREVQGQGVPVVGDMDLFLRRAPGKLYGITGTNGKTTTTLLTHKLLQSQYGKHCRMLGNVGLPALDSLPKLTRDSRTTIELSSFQLEELTSLPLNIALLTNLQPDHLDRHGSFRSYAEAKGRILTLLDSNATAIYNFDCQHTCNMVLPLGTKARLVPFSRKSPLEVGAYFDHSDLVLAHPNGYRHVIRDYSVRKRFFGDHNLENVLASSLIAFLAGVEPEEIERVVLGFCGVEYRVEKFHATKGVDFYDDSKGTNPDATEKAVAAVDRRIRLVAGGSDKGFDFKPLAQKMMGKVVKAYLFGEIADSLGMDMLHISAPIPYDIYDNLEDATLDASREARAGEAVLFSPASASPPGEKYYQRGNRFKATVREQGPNELKNLPEILSDPLAH